MTEQNHLAGAGKEIGPVNKLRAECVIIGNAISPKVEIDLEPSGHNSFTGLGSFNIGGDKFFVKVTLMPEKVGNVFAQRKNGNVVYLEVSE